jgi:hypothetical protein
MAGVCHLSSDTARSGNKRALGNGEPQQKILDVTANLVIVGRYNLLHQNVLFSSEKAQSCQLR